ncbi:MAG: beta-ketoacyl-ACP synthase I, partial [Alphaproteobacteria bacterium]|nr:beta-ketoacyl-ACP synthase I [Alphaproteobacteria bacterium]
MKRVVVTGIGIISCIGNDQDEVTQSLKDGKSGIVFSPKYAEMGFRTHVHGQPNINLTEKIDRRLLRFMGEGSAYNYLAME